MKKWIILGTLLGVAVAGIKVLLDNKYENKNPKLWHLKENQRNK